MSHKQIVCSFCHKSPTQSIGFLTKTDCCRTYICRSCKYNHICYSLPIQTLPFKSCSRCQQNPIQINCQHCSYLGFCTSCDEQLHQNNKFAQHSRTSISCLSQSTRHEQDISHSQNQLTQRLKSEPALHNPFKTAMTSINITQEWENIINEVKRKFVELIDALKQKQTEIVQKLQKKKLKDLNSYEDLVEEYMELSKKNMKKSMQYEKIQLVRNKLRAYEESYLQGCDGSKVSKFNLNTSYFESVMGKIEKMELNGLIIKVSNKIDHGHRTSKRSSMMFGGSGAQSTSYLKTPKQSTKERMSTSALDVDAIQVTQKMNEEESDIVPLPKTTKYKPNLNISMNKQTNKTKNKVKKNESMNSHISNINLNSSTSNNKSINSKLHKTASEKVIACKSPKSFKNYFNSPTLKGFS